jgi:hypothetical protein
MKRDAFPLIFCALASAALLLAAAAKSSANGVLLTSVKGWPNGRLSNDTPPNAIDGNTNTFTWTTESFNFNNPSFLGVGFNSSPIGRIRLWKTPDGGGGANIKDLIIQYTNDSTATALDLRTWQNVSGLTNGYFGTELFNASAVNANGTVTGDVHDSPGGNGWGSLTFNAVLATGMRIAFANPGSGQVVHYRVGEFEVYIPEPATISLLMIGVFAMLAQRKRPVK